MRGGGGGVNDVTTFLENIIMDHKYQGEYHKSRIIYDKKTQKKLNVFDMRNRHPCEKNTEKRKIISIYRQTE